MEDDGEDMGVLNQPSPPAASQPGASQPPSNGPAPMEADAGPIIQAGNDEMDDGTGGSEHISEHPAAPSPSPPAMPSDVPPAPALPSPADHSDPASRLNELEAFLRQPDAIMELRIMDKLREYVSAHGHPKQAVEFLSEGYVGYAQMGTLVCSWLKFTQPEAKRDPRGGESGGAGARDARDGAHEEILGAAEPAEHDEAHFLRQLVKERFDPQRFAHVFRPGGPGAPVWLEALLEDPAGRHLIYDLSSRHQNSLLLNFAIHKILQHPELEAEVAALGSTLAGDFKVFHRLTALRLRHVASSSDPAELDRLGKELGQGCARSQHAYAHVQQLLTALAADDGPGAARFRRLSQELEAAAAEVAGPSAWKMQRWFAPNAHPATAAAAALVSDLLAAASSGGAAAASDVLKLYRLYCPGPGPAEAVEVRLQDGGPDAVLPRLPPPVSLLRHPRLIELLLQALLNPARQLQPESQAAHITLLSLATAAVEEARSRAEQAGAEQQPQTDRAAAAAAGVGAEALSGLNPLLKQPAVVATRAALEAAAEVGHKALRDELLTSTEQERLDAAAAQPCCAAGLLGMLRSRLTSSEYWATCYHVHKEPPFLALLHAVVARQPAMHAEVLALVGDALAAMGHAPSGPDVARGLVDVALALLRAGRVDAVLQWADAWGRNADAGLVRHLTFGLLQAAAPPYSPSFAAAVLRLMDAGGMRRQRVGAREWGVRAPLLTEFIASCGEVRFSPPLPAPAAALLRELAVSLRAQQRS